MSGFLDNIDRLQKTLQDLQPLKPEDQERLDKKFRLEFNYNSNHIEGNTLTYSETKLLLLFDDVKGNHTLREYEEMKSHDVAYKLIEEWATDTERPLSENKIKELNQILLVRPYWKKAITEDGQQTRREIKVGDYKQYPNSVRLENGEMFHYASPVDTPIKMQELTDWYRAEEGNIHPVTLAALLHYKFVSIHPFDDGNGRISRLLVNYVLIKNGFPPVVIKSRDKANYLRALHLADVGDTDAFVKYIVDQVIWSLEISIAAGKGEDIEEKNDWEKELDLIKKETGLRHTPAVKERNTKKNIRTIVKTTLLPFMRKWEIELAKFDSLFYERISSLVIADNLMNSAKKFNSNSFNDLELLSEIERSFNQENLIQGIGLYCEYKNIRTLPKDDSLKRFQFYAGTFVLSFHTNAYELDFQNILPTRSFLYTEFLREDEIDEIINIFSKNLLKKIKQ